MVDDASRIWQLSDAQILTEFVLKDLCVRCENIYNLMRTLSWFLSVARKCEHGNMKQSFGQPYHYVVDRIQIAVQRDYNALLSFIPGI